MENQEVNHRELLHGATLQNGKYVIERVIGAGGFGITYYARHTSLNQHYAIKEFFMDGRCVRDTVHHTISLQGIGPELFEKYRSKFVEEAQTLVHLEHPNIVKVIDVFDENGTSYIVMPFINGKTMDAIVRKTGPMDYCLAVNYIGQIASAVGYIHQRKILHRDIKPDNIMITADNKAILIDFGSAREFIQDKTQRQTSILTKGYAPIEQYSSTSRKGSYTDIYALGAVFYFALTGETPMEAVTRLMETMPEPRELNPNISEDANRTIMKAMQLKQEYRHQTIDEFMEDLLGKTPSQAAAKSNTISDYQDSLSPQLEKTEGKRKKTLVIAAIGIVIFVIILLIIVLRLISGPHLTVPDVTDSKEVQIENRHQGSDVRQPAAKQEPSGQDPVKKSEEKKSSQTTGTKDVKSKELTIEEEIELEIIKILESN